MYYLFSYQFISGFIDIYKGKAVEIKRQICQRSKFKKLQKLH